MKKIQASNSLFSAALNIAAKSYKHNLYQAGNGSIAEP